MAKQLGNFSSTSATLRYSYTAYSYSQLQALGSNMVLSAYTTLQCYNIGVCACRGFSRL